MRPLELYLRYDRKPVEPSSGREWSTVAAEQAAELGSAMLKDATQALFREWERKHGFVEGSGEILLPAGWRPE